MLRVEKSEEALDRRTHALLIQRPEETARQTLTRRQRILILLSLLACSLAFALHPLRFVIWVNAALTAFYLILSVFKIHLMNLSLGRSREVQISEEDLQKLQDADLPLYSVLVPLYKEPETLPQLIASMEGMDYPKDKLDVIVLLEPDDVITQEAVAQMSLPPCIQVVVVPDSIPKTKPKACNLGLHMARGEFLVIYDAEDRPEPDQLKKAVCGFRKSGPKIVCLQAKLNFYNQRQNWLTRWFTVEYSSWFDLFLPGLSAMEAPIPLGGTSNHFRTGQLRDLLGWDPFNVAEDCDLGMRLARRGFGTLMMDSTTWEEACGHPYHWYRQRSRWIKGYLQTFLVHMRYPLRTWRELGFQRGLAFILTVGGTVLSFLLNPIYWGMTLLWFFTRSDLLGSIFPPLVFVMGALCLFVGNFTFAYACGVAAYKRRQYDLVKAAILIPPYWLAMSLGAWKGSLQLIFRPYYWEKTKHGLSLPPGQGPGVKSP